MALPIETPSRIWRRIEEGEARDDMPSLPSLPAFDISGIDERQTSSLSLAKIEHALPNRPDSMKGSMSQPSLGSSYTARFVDNEPTANPLKSSGHMSKSLHDRPVYIEDGNMELACISQSMKYGSDEEGHDHEQIDTKKSHDVETFRRSCLIPNSDEDDEDLSLTEALVSVNRAPSPLPLSNASFAFDESHVASPKPQGSSRSTGASSSMKERDSKDVVRKSHDTVPPPALSRSVSSLSSSTWSLPKSTHSEDNNSNHSFDVHEADEKVADESEVHNNQQSGSNYGEEASAEEKQGKSRKAETRDSSFSLDDDTSVPGIRSVHFPPSLSSPPAMPTHTPAYQPRMAGSRPCEHERQEEREEVNDLATPFPRRKSFLLSVVNSNPRPRLTLTAPHPRVLQQPANSINARLTPAPSRPFKAGIRRSRMSHALSQVHTFQPTTPFNNSPSRNDVDSTPSGGNASFISTASSHDLTVQHRANASFDPVTGPQGVGRFNAGKLNTYLHGLNRRLQEENESLMERVRNQQQEIEALHEGLQGRELSGVMEDKGAEQWVLEKEVLEKKFHELQATLEAREKELADEQKERMRDKDRWKVRMFEVEEGVGDIVRDLEMRARDAEAKVESLRDIKTRTKDAETSLTKIKAECGILNQCAEQAERIMASEQDLGTEPRKANDERDRLERQLQTSAVCLQQKEEALTSFRTRISELEEESSSLKSTIRDLESNLQLSRESVESSQEESKALRQEQWSLREELQKAQSLVARLKTDSALAVDKIRRLEERLSEMGERLEESEEALEKANELGRARLEDALEESDHKISSDNNELAEIRTKLASLEREKSRSLGMPQVKSTLNEVATEALETELSEAYKEIGRLTALLNRSPARKAIETTKDAHIDILEKENEELLNQFRLTRDLSADVTPRRNTGMSGISPMHRHLINLSMKTPRTPGEPLHDASWLMSMTGDTSAARLLAEIGRLQKELDIANESIDDKLDKLEEAGLGVVDLTKALEGARRRISTLEAQLAHSEERGTQCLEKSVCFKCGKSDLGKSNPKDSNASLQLRLTLLTAELGALRKQRDEEMACSSGEKAVLRDAANRLNTEIRRTKEVHRAAQEKGYTAEETKAELQQELAKAKNAIDDLEHLLLSERSRLRTMSAENDQAAKEKERILEKLKETESKMENAKDRLLYFKEANIKLEAGLRAVSLEEKLAGNRETVEQLRQERSRLADKHFDLQRRLAEASRQASEVSAKHADLQNSYDSRRRQLDQQSREIEDLRAAISSQSEKLNHALTEKKFIQSGDTDVHAVASKLGAELWRIQQEADRFGHDLRQLRAGRDKMVIQHRRDLEQRERTNKRLRTQLRLLKEQLAGEIEKHRLSAVSNDAVDALKLKHNRECKGLFVQIRYLKAKYTREASLRNDLGYQKHYLLILLSRFEKSENRILATIAQIGFPAPPNPHPQTKLKVAVLAIVFILRARRACELWREQKAARAIITEALKNVRKTRLEKQYT